MKRIKIFIIVLIISYLMGAFYNASFNINLWSAVSRLITLVFGVIFSVAISTFPNIDELYK